MRSGSDGGNLAQQRRDQARRHVVAAAEQRIGFRQLLDQVGVAQQRRFRVVLARRRQEQAGCARRSAPPIPGWRDDRDAPPTCRATAYPAPRPRRRGASRPRCASGCRAAPASRSGRADTAGYAAPPRPWRPDRRGRSSSRHRKFFRSPAPRKRRRCAPAPAPAFRSARAPSARRAWRLPAPPSTRRRAGRAVHRAGLQLLFPVIGLHRRLAGRVDAAQLQAFDFGYQAVCIEQHEVGRRRAMLALGQARVTPRDPRALADRPAAARSTPARRRRGPPLRRTRQTSRKSSGSRRRAARVKW